MRTNSRLVAGLLVAAVLTAVSPSIQAQGLPPASQPAGGLPHVTIDRQQRCIDLEATVVLHESEWLELLACSPRSREHEAILTIPARPSHIHLALLTLGVQPGAPMKWWRQGDQAKWSDPTGPRIAVTILFEQNGKKVEIPANEWILNQKTKEVLQGNHWIFTGSEFSELDGERVYRADLNGTVISLVNFGDDLLSRQTEMTNTDDDSTWGVNVKAVPPVGTKVIVRLKPLENAATQPATQPAGK